MKCRRCREIIFSPIELASAIRGGKVGKFLEKERGGGREKREASVKNEIKEKKEENE